MINMVRWGRWCPNGCGKSVVSRFLSYRIKKRYYCDRCKKWFVYEDLAELNNNISHNLKRWRQRKYVKLQKKKSVEANRPIYKKIRSCKKEWDDRPKNSRQPVKKFKTKQKVSRR